MLRREQDDPRFLWNLRATIAEQSPSSPQFPRGQFASNSENVTVQGSSIRCKADLHQGDSNGWRDDLATCLLDLPYHTTPQRHLAQIDLFD